LLVSSLSLTLSHTQPHTLTLYLSLKDTHILSLSRSLSLSFTHTHTHKQTHTRTHTHARSLSISLLRCQIHPAQASAHLLSQQVMTLSSSFLPKHFFYFHRPYRLRISADLAGPHPQQDIDRIRHALEVPPTLLSTQQATGNLRWSIHCVQVATQKGRLVSSYTSVLGDI